MKLKDLLFMNQEVQKTFLKVQSDSIDYGLKSFFKAKVTERNTFGKLLQAELNKLEAKAKTSILMQNRSHYFRSPNLKNVLQIHRDLDLFNQVYKVLQVSIKKYNALLMEIDLPLSLCKLLIKQRDRIQSSLDLIKQEVAITGFV